MWQNVLSISRVLALAGAGLILAAGTGQARPHGGGHSGGGYHGGVHLGGGYHGGVHLGGAHLGGFHSPAYHPGYRPGAYYGTHAYHYPHHYRNNSTLPYYYGYYNTM